MKFASNKIIQHYNFISQMNSYYVIDSKYVQYLFLLTNRINEWGFNIKINRLKAMFKFITNINKYGYQMRFTEV